MARMPKPALLKTILRPLRWLRGGRATKPSMTGQQWIERRRSQSKHDLPNVFAVISWGCNATTWLANTLAAHPGVLSVHCCSSVYDLFYPPEACPDDVGVLSLLQLLGRGYALAGDDHGISRT